MSAHERLRETLAAAQAESIDAFIAWWERHMPGSGTRWVRRGSVLAGMDTAPDAEPVPSYDLGGVTEYWQDRWHALAARLKDELSEIQVLAGPIFSMDVNAFPLRVDDAGYLLLLHQGWIQLGRWVAQTLAVIEAAEPHEVEEAAERFRTLPRLAADILGDDSLDLDDWLPAPMDDRDVEHPVVLSYVAQGESFVLLHELAHVRLGHVEALEALYARGAGEQEIAAFRRRCEFDADSLAVQLLVEASPSGHVDEWALCALFWLLHTAEQFSVYAWADPELATHPPAAERLEFAVRELSTWQPLHYGPELLVGIARSLEPDELVLQEKSEDDLGPWRILSLKLPDGGRPDR